MFIGEGPGWHESQTGTPFVETAPAGAELTRYLNGYTLPTRDAVFITNLVREWEGGSRTKQSEVTAADIARDEGDLRLDLSFVRPQIVVPLGLHATRWFLGPDVDMDTVHGLLFTVDYCRACGSREEGALLKEGFHTDACTFGDLQSLWVVPCYHPAAGLHRPDLAARTAYDLQQVARVLRMTETEREAAQWRPSPPCAVWEIDRPQLVPRTFSPGLVAIDTEGTPSRPWCWSAAMVPGKAVVGVGATVPLPFRTDNRAILHNAVWDLQVIDAMGAIVGDDAFEDTMVLAFLLGIEPQGLKALAYRLLGLTLDEYKDVVGKWVQEFTKTGKPKKKKTFVLGTLDDVPRDKAVAYAGADADATLRIFPILKSRVHDLGMDEVYEIDRAVLPVYARMESLGLPIALEHFVAFGADLTAALERKTREIQEAFPTLEPGSPKQVSKVLYQDLRLTGGKPTKTGHLSTNDKFLEAMRGQHPLVEQIIEWREIDKLKGSFVDTLPDHLRWDEKNQVWRLTFRVLPTRVVTGRIAAKELNVLALPKKSDLGKQFRRGIVAPEGKELQSFDLSQIELRVLALDSGSAYLIRVFQEGGDIHAGTQQRIYGADTDLTDEGLRRDAKIVNFSIPMGTTPFGMVDQLKRVRSVAFKAAVDERLESGKKAAGQSRKNAELAVAAEWIQGVIDLWEITPYIEAKKAEARRYGYVSDRWGRKRWLPSVLSPNLKIREEAFRQAQSFPMQAGNRGYFKLILARVWREVIRPWNRDGVDIQPLLDIHDDLLLEVPLAQADEAFETVGDIFNNSFEEIVPIVAKGKRGPVWGDLE
jgi:DNA polymerase I-like protein with 3'-5' exonuclease and polymerase domains/uracil-DNA glycosylase